jgi:hypothetical protein
MSRLIPVSLCILLLGSACARTQVDRPLGTEYPQGDAHGEMEFWHGMSEHSAITNDEALHALRILLDGSDPSASYEERVEHFVQSGDLAENFDEPADFAVQRGTVARILARALQIEGGVMMWLTDGHPRYANRELVVLGIMPPGSELMTLDGTDFLGVISRAEDYLEVVELEQAVETTTDNGQSR